MTDINVVEEIQRRVRNQINLLRQELLSAGLHPLEAEAITVEERSDGVTVTAVKVTAAARKAYDREQEEAAMAEESPAEGFNLGESRLDEDAVLGNEATNSFDHYRDVPDDFGEDDDTAE